MRKTWNQTRRLSQKQAAIEKQRQEWEKRPYIEVRKVPWDELWHAIKEKRPGGTDLYDRVDKATALKIAREMKP